MQMNPKRKGGGRVGTEKGGLLGTRTLGEGGRGPYQISSPYLRLVGRGRCWGGSEEERSSKKKKGNTGEL